MISINDSLPEDRELCEKFNNMKIKSNVLILNLIEETRQLINKAELLKTKSDAVLNYKEDLKSWSILECLEHLNLYGRFYLPEITSRINKTPFVKDAEFKSGWLGNYFAKSMMPKAKVNKMMTFKSMNPINSNLDRTVIDSFINQQTEMLELLNKARNVSLNKVKTGISITKWINLKLGDTFRFVVYHNQRHMLQAEKILHQAEYKSANG